MISKAATVSQTKRIHPKKFLLYFGIGSVMMMFFAFTSAYLVGRQTGTWDEFKLPNIFWLSTVIMVCSSLTMYLAHRNFKLRNMPAYRIFIVSTLALGILFVGTQIYAFSELYKMNITLAMKSAAFLYVIFGAHAVHVGFGIIALAVILVKLFSGRSKNYDNNTIEMMSIYWHFVDLLWIYLFIFLLLIR